MKIWYVPLEPYESRYTWQLRDWTIAEFVRLEQPYVEIQGKLIFDGKINTGQVLDVHTRCFWALEQIQELIIALRYNELSKDDFILFEDMFHPGIESLAYIFNQQFNNKPRPKIGVRCLAQTIDPDDFTHYTNMSEWMRHYEKMVNVFVDLIFVASQEMIPFMTAAGWDVPVVVTGLPFGKKEVVSRVAHKGFDSRKNRVVFASRLAPEKQPEFFIELATHYKVSFPDVEFAFVSGGLIKYPGVDKAVANGIISVYPNLCKNEYYEILGDSKVLFNCSLQDWVSNTVSEADALGCNVLFPAYRSFPEVFENDHKRMYIPWSIEDAFAKLNYALEGPSSKIGIISDYQDKSIARTIKCIDLYMKGMCPTINPLNTRYRNQIIRKVLS